MKNIIAILLLAGGAFAAGLSAPEIKAESKTAIAITGTDVQDAIAFQFHLTLPEGVHTIGSNHGCSTPTDFSIFCNEVNGEVYVAAYSAYPLGEDGVMAFIRVSGEGEGGLTFSSAYVFDQMGLLPTTTEDGWLLLY